MNTVGYNVFYHQTDEKSAKKIMKNGFNTSEVWAAADDEGSYGDVNVMFFAPEPQKPFFMNIDELIYNYPKLPYAEAEKLVIENYRLYRDLGGETNSGTFNKLREMGYDVIIHDNGDRTFLYPNTLKFDFPFAAGGQVNFISAPIAELTVSLADFQGRTEAYSSVTYNRIVNDVKSGKFNFSALPAIQIWKDNRTGKWVILAGHSRTAAFTDLAAGKYSPLPEKYKESDFSTIHAQVVEAETLEEAKLIAQESNAAGTQSELDFALNLARPMRNKMTPSEYKTKMRDLFGDNYIWVNELSYLNPNGRAISAYKQIQGTTDKSQKANFEKILSSLGNLRIKIPQLTNAHEDEIYDWLTKNINDPNQKVREKVSSKTAVFEEISSRVMRFDFQPDQPLNLANVGTKSIYQVTYDQQLKDLKKEIDDKKAEYEATKNRFFAAKLSNEEIENRLDPQEKYIIRLQRDYMALLQKGQEVNEASKGILGLFDNPAPAQEVGPSESELKNFAEKMSYLKRLLGDKLAPSAPVAVAQRFKSTILQSEFARGENSMLKFGLLSDFLLDQLDFWMTEFEARFVTETKAEKTPYKYDPHKIRLATGYQDVDMLKQICETAIHLFADYLIKGAENALDAYGRLVDFYKHQPKVTWRSSKSISLQQYSTPVPLAYCMSKFCIPAPKFGQRYLEPSAGTGLLTIGSPPEYWTVNEIDKDRLLCLEFLGFTNTSSIDSDNPLPFPGLFDAVVTNPPFSTRKPAAIFDGRVIKRQEHAMALFALQKLAEDGRAAILIGGNNKYNENGFIEPHTTDRVFLSFLYDRYNVVDVINIEPDVYISMGANTPVRIILIDGLATAASLPSPPFYKDIAHLSATERNSPVPIRDLDELGQRVFGQK